MNKILALTALILCGHALATEQTIQKAEFTGQGRIETSPDFITLDFNVNSQCYATPQEAQESTDRVVKQIYDYLETLRTPQDPHFKILVSGGYTSSYSRWGQNRNLCENTFQKITRITLKIAPDLEFHKTFSAIQTHALKHFSQTFDQATETPVTFVHIEAPNPSITPQHQMKLERKAMNLAVLNAKDKFKAATQSCQKQPWKILQITEDANTYLPPQRPLHYARAMSAEAQDMGKMAAPVSFDDMVVEKALRVTFMFDGAMCYSP